MLDVPRGRWMTGEVYLLQVLAPCWWFCCIAAGFVCTVSSTSLVIEKFVWWENSCAMQRPQVPFSPESEADLQTSVHTNRFRPFLGFDERCVLCERSCRIIAGNVVLHKLIIQCYCDPLNAIPQKGTCSKRFNVTLPSTVCQEGRKGKSRSVCFWKGLHCTLLVY